MKFGFYALKLCIACIIVFVLQLLIPGFTELFILNKSAYIEIWRFASSIFLHASVAHILYNLFALALFGSMLESLVGGRKFLLIFFATGILANIIAVNFYDSALGASGAIYGVIGALIIVRPLLMVWAFGLPMPIFIAGIIWAAGDFIGLFMPSNVGNIAHLSGIFFGLIFGFIFRNWKNEKERNGNASNSFKYKVDEDKVREWEDYYLRR